MTTEPYASANRVFWMVGNGSSHRGEASVQRMASTWPNAQLIHLPAHASWLDQAEIYFSVVQRKALTPLPLTCGTSVLRCPVRWHVLRIGHGRL